MATSTTERSTNTETIDGEVLESPAQQSTSEKKPRRLNGLAQVFGRSRRAASQGAAASSTKQGARNRLIASLVIGAGLRLLTFAAYYAILTFTAFGAIPQLAGWVHAQSLARTGTLSADGLIAVWLVPLLFLVAMLGVLEFIIMRAMWRAGSAIVASVRKGEPLFASATATDDASEVVALKTPSASTHSTPHRTDRNNRNKKNR